MAKFKTTLKLQFDAEFITDCGPWWVIEPFIYYSDIIGRDIIVKPPFPTDLASVPRVPILYDAVGNIAIKPSVIHDYLYTSKEVDRKTADLIFKEASNIEKISSWRIHLMYYGIRMFGKSRYGT